MGSETVTLHRIACISTLPPDRGNLAEYSSYLTEAFVRAPGVASVEVFANEVPMGAAEEELHPGLYVRRCWRLGSWWSLFRLVGIIGRTQPDMVHINAGIRTWGEGRIVSMVGAMLPMLLRFRGMRVITTLHTIGDTVQLDQMGTPIGLLTRIGIQCATWLYLRSNIVTVTLATIRLSLMQRFAARNTIHVAHGTYGPRVAKPSTGGARILAFGFWGAFKDAELLVQSVAQVRTRGIDAQLVLGGGAHPYYPEIYADLVNRCADIDYVQLTGYVTEEKLGALFESVTAVVMPYRTNAGASGVLNLCRSYGVPIIISNEPALLEQVRHEGGAALVYESPLGLVEALERLCRDEDLQRQMGKANLDVTRRMTIDTQARRMVALMEGIVNDARHDSITDMRAIGEDIRIPSVPIDGTVLVSG